MEIIRELEHSDKPTSVALGFFDGVHLGHQTVINEAVTCAEKNNLVPTVCTFSESPRSVIKGNNIGSIITCDEKISVFESLGIQRVYMLDFRKIMGFSAEQFVEKAIVESFNAKHAVCGFNYHFGSGGSGNRYILQDLCKKNNITVSAQNQIDFNGMPISSTRIRQSIMDGDIKSVNSMLGRMYGFKLPVIHGRQLGRKLGTPTINQKFPSGSVLPLFGVYASAVNIDGKLYCGVTNIGIKPTVGSDDVLIETWMPDYIGRELYDENIDVRFISHIRAEKKFEGVDSLKDEIVKNGIQAKEIFENYLKGGF